MVRADLDVAVGVTVESSAGVTRITLDRPQARNALTVPGRLALRDALQEADRSDDVRVVVLRGRGEHFCAGADIGELAVERDGAEARRYAEDVAQVVFTAVRSMRTPTVAAVDGAAAGAGMFLALGCDIVLATTRARFVAAQLALGVPPDWGAVWLLPRLVGLTRAKQLLLTGRPVDGVTAERWGLVAEVVEPDALDVAVDRVCGQLAAAPADVLGLTRAGLDASLDTSLEEFLTWEASAIAAALPSPEHRRRVRDFLDRKAARAR